MAHIRSQAEHQIQESGELCAAKLFVYRCVYDLATLETTTTILLATEAEYQQGFTRIDKRVAPVEIVFIGKCIVTEIWSVSGTYIAGVLLAKLRNCSWEERAKAVLDLRTFTRELHKDVRGNERVMKTMWQFVEKVKTESANPFEGWEAPGAVDDPPPKKKADKKRKREKDDDAPHRPTPRKLRSPLKQEPTSNGVPFVA